MNKALFHDSFAALRAKFCAAETDVTAGGTGDNTEVSTAYLDVTEYNSVTFLLPFTATLGDGESLAISGNLQDASAIGGTGVGDFGDAIAATTVITNSGGGTETGVAVAEFDVSQTRGYVRFQFTPNLSAANTDTAKIGCVAVLGGLHGANPEDDATTSGSPVFVRLN